MVTCTTTVGLTAGQIMLNASLWYVVAADRKRSIRFEEEEFGA